MAHVLRWLVLVFFILAVTPALTSAAECESLATLRLAAVTVTRAEVVPAGRFVLPEGVSATAGDGRFLTDLSREGLRK